MTVARKEAVKNAENDKNSGTITKADENDENPKTNLAQVLYIQYFYYLLE